MQWNHLTAHILRKRSNQLSTPWALEQWALAAQWLSGEQSFLCGVCMFSQCVCFLWGLWCPRPSKNMIIRLIHLSVPLGPGCCSGMGSKQRTDYTTLIWAWLHAKNTHTNHSYLNLRKVFLTFLRVAKNSSRFIHKNVLEYNYVRPIVPTEFTGASTVSKNKKFPSCETPLDMF